MIVARYCTAIFPMLSTNVLRNNPLRASISSRTLHKGLPRHQHLPTPQHHHTTIRAPCSTQATALKDTILSKNSDNPVIVYIKSTCPYCQEVQHLFKTLNVPAKVVALDQLEDGYEVQQTLQEISGMRTVPQVFINGSLVGGCDDTVAAYQSGQLKSLLAGVGIDI